MTWASFTDVTDRWVGSGEPTNETLVAALLADAEAVILSQFPRIGERVDAGTLDVSVIIFVECRMVSRVLRNPESLTYWQQNTGPFGQGKNYGSDNADIWLTPDEIKMLSPKVKGKAFEVNQAPNAYPGIPVTPFTSDTSFGDLNLLPYGGE